MSRFRYFLLASNVAVVSSHSEDVSLTESSLSTNSTSGLLRLKHLTCSCLMALHSLAGLQACSSPSSLAPRNDIYAFILAEGATHVVTLDSSRKIAFTLAEVLITLGIIGVVAALTLPSLIADYQEKQVVSQLKKSYSTIQQAFLSAKNEYGDIADWSDKTTKAEISEDWYLKLKPYLSVVKYCGYASSTPKDCMGNSYQTLNRNRTNINLNDNGLAGVNFVLADGSSVRFVAYDKDCKYGGQDYCGSIYIDLNGAKKPNQIGRDYFYFAIYPEKIIPGGSPINDENNFREECNMESSYTSNGDACAAWLLINENMDYLHCNDLTWHGKTSCR